MSIATRHPEAASDWTLDQGWADYTPSEHKVWITLYERQVKIIAERACDEVLRGLALLDLHGQGIPDFRVLNKALKPKTGWEVVAVPGLVPDAVFFEHLANRRFPAGRFIRTPEQLDYLQEPDVFHDVFGHVPLLADPVFADYLQAYGQGGLRALGLGQLHNLARLYWYTVEFGLVQTAQGLRIYGAGILSSRTESIYSLESHIPNRLGFDMERVMRTPYRIDDVQQTYFITPSLQHLLDATLQDFSALYDRLAKLPDLGLTEILPSDQVYSGSGPS
jgi:phenylalanine-4-hydroxylase